MGSARPQAQRACGARSHDGTLAVELKGLRRRNPGTSKLLQKATRVARQLLLRKGRRCLHGGSDSVDRAS
jgi:hypothetical protein